MGQRTVGATILAAGLAGGVGMVLADAGIAALVTAAAVGLTGLLVLREGRAVVPSASTADGPDGAAFAETMDEDGQPLWLARGDVDAVFSGLLDRWRGVVSLRLGDDADGPPARLDAAVVELRGDILRAEAYLDGLRFRHPDDRRPYDTVVAELEVLLRRVGDPDWGRDRQRR